MSTSIYSYFLVLVSSWEWLLMGVLCLFWAFSFFVLCLWAVPKYTALLQMFPNSFFLMLFSKHLIAEPLYFKYLPHACEGKIWFFPAGICIIKPASIQRFNFRASCRASPLCSKPHSICQSLLSSHLMVILLMVICVHHFECIVWVTFMFSGDNFHL